MFEIKKHNDRIEVSVSLQQRAYARESKFRVSWKDALDFLKKEEPNLEFIEEPDHKGIADNYNGNGSVTWVFKREQAKSKKTKNKITKKAAEEPESGEKGGEDDLPPLTIVSQHATVEETSQSDQPAIVQEPTE